MFQSNNNLDRKEKTREAIGLALQSRWTEAIAVNEAILELFPDDVGAHNRLGKALSELGRNQDARQAFGRAMELQPYNAIARRNLERLSQLGNNLAGPRVTTKLTPRLFLEESGKTSLTVLRNSPSIEAIALMTPGDTVHLAMTGKSLWVRGSNGEHLGQVEPKLATRLTRLMEEGNQYVAALTSVTEHKITVLIREVYQHPDLAGIPSFLQKGDSPLISATELSLPYIIDEIDAPEEHRPPPIPAWTDEDDEDGKTSRGSQDQDMLEEHLTLGLELDEGVEDQEAVF